MNENYDMSLRFVLQKIDRIEKDMYRLVQDLKDLKNIIYYVSEHVINEED